MLKEKVAERASMKATGEMGLLPEMVLLHKMAHQVHQVLEMVHMELVLMELAVQATTEMVQANMEMALTVLREVDLREVDT